MSKAEAFEVNFGENKSIGVNVNFSKGDAIQVPVSINSLDAEKVADRIADQLQLPEIDTTELAKQGENQDATNTAILAEIKRMSSVNRAMTLNRGGELKDYTIFFDIDGTILYAFTQDEIMQLTELPEPYVHHDRLTFDRWSYTLEELKQANGWRDVGAHYYPTDGFGEFELDYRDCQLRTPHIGVKMRTADGLIVDWGDGNIETIPVALEFDLQHTYAVPAKYLMRWKQENDAKIYGVYVWNDTKSHVVGRCVYPTNAERLSCTPLTGQTENTTSQSTSAQGIGLTLIEELAIPFSCKLADGADSGGLYGRMPLLKAVSGHVASSYFDRGTGVTNNSYFLESALFVSIVGVPNNHVNKSAPAFARSYFFDSTGRFPELENNNIERIGSKAEKLEYSWNTLTSGKLKSIPALSAADYQEKWFRNCKYLEVTPDLSNYSFGTLYGSYINNCKLRDYGKEWESSSVRDNCFENNYSLLTFTTSNVTTQIRANAFLNGISLNEFHVKRSLVVDGSITTLANKTAFSGCPSTMKIFVPADSVAAYQAATNWVTYASQIFAEPETTE